MSEEEKRSFCAFLLKQYGISLSPQDELLGVYYLAYKATEKSLQSSEELTGLVSQLKMDLQGVLTLFTAKVEKNLSKIAPQQLRFGSKEEALFYGLGAKALPQIVGSLLLFIFSCYFLHWQKEGQRNQLLTSFINKAEVEEKQINNSQGVYLIKLYQAKSLGQAREGTHFVYNESCECIQVPVSFTAK